MEELNRGIEEELKILDSILKNKDNKTLALLIATERIKQIPDFYSKINWIKNSDVFLDLLFENSTEPGVRLIINQIEIIQKVISDLEKRSIGIVFKEILNDELKKIQFTLNRLRIQIDIFDS